MDRNSLIMSCDGDSFPTHGFVQVGEPVSKEGYTLMKRSSSMQENTNETLFSLYRNLQRDMMALEQELVEVRRKEVINDRWSKRYSRRLAVWANLLLGLWIFWFHFMKTLKKKRNMKTRILRAMVSETNTVNGMLWEASMAGTRHGIVFVFFAFLLTRPLAWARYTGVMLSSGWSLYLALFFRFLPWTNYFTVLANVLYWRGMYKRQEPLPSLKAFMASKGRASVAAKLASSSVLSHDYQHSTADYR